MPGREAFLQRLALIAERRWQVLQRQLPGRTVAERDAPCYSRAIVVDYMAAFDRRADLCGGELVVKGTRVPVRAILASLAEGTMTSEILSDFPTLTETALRAVIAFAAASAEEDLPIPSVPALA